MARRREINPFSLSFLDIMSCGLGAVILFFMIITSQVRESADVVLEEARAAADRLEVRVLAGQKNLEQLKLELSDLVSERASTQAQSSAIVAAIRESEDDLADLRETTLARNESVEQLKADLKRLEEETRRLSAQSVTPEQAGTRIRAVTGEGNRQYLTGLRVGGRRVLVLVDTSASMLDESIVNIVRRRNMPYEQKVRAPKWQRTLATVDWLTAQIPEGSQFQIYGFGAQAKSLIEGSDGEWLTAASADDLDAAVEALRSVEPDGGTSLHAAFDVVSALQPKPDNVYLVTDGLPTQGATMPTNRTVSGRERVKHFERAVRRLPLNVPINVILFPIEGDPQAAPAFWQLALETGGSFMSPSEGWP